MENTMYVAGAVLLTLVGLIHSVLGEVLIFSRMRTEGVVPTNGGSVLRERHVRILWATWHVVTVLAFLAAAAILNLTSSPSAGPGAGWMEAMVVAALLASSALVGIGTRARHPGWAGLLAVAVLVGLGTYAR
ncbi:hypothetical protein [Simplicispira suum]|uniref:hypothetical protein n=1 Tax=Simplicispira suum TaxID=2109915 RepID=UPI002356326F|nr:hypothetical protein [Simplicispira suum]